MWILEKTLKKYTQTKIYLVLRIVEPSNIVNKSESADHQEMIDGIAACQIIRYGLCTESTLLKLCQPK